MAPATGTDILRTSIYVSSGLPCFHYHHHHHIHCHATCRITAIITETTASSTTTPCTKCIISDVHVNF